MLCFYCDGRLDEHGDCPNCANFCHECEQEMPCDDTHYYAKPDEDE